MSKNITIRTDIYNKWKEWNKGSFSEYIDNLQKNDHKDNLQAQVGKDGRCYIGTDKAGKTIKYNVETETV